MLVAFYGVSPPQHFTKMGCYSSEDAARKLSPVRHPPHFARREEKSKQVVAATSEANFDEGIGGKNDYSPLLSGQF